MKRGMKPRPLRSSISIAVIAALATLVLLGLSWATQNSNFLSCTGRQLISRQGGSRKADFASDSSLIDGPEHKKETFKPPVPSCDDSSSKRDCSPKYMVPGQQHLVCNMTDAELQHVLSMPHDQHRGGSRYFFDGAWMLMDDLLARSRNLNDTDGCVVVHIGGQMPCADVPDGCVLHFHVRLKETDLIVMLHLVEEAELAGLDKNMHYNSILDAGGNIGIAAVLFAVQYPMARVVSVEPGPRNFEVLRKNLEPFLNAAAFHGGVWSRTRTLEIYDAHIGEWGITVREAGSPKVGDETLLGSLSGMSIPQIAELANIDSFDLIKVDIEGSEKEVFGENADLRYLRKARTVLVETHDRYWPGCTELVNKAFASDFVTSTSGEYIVFNRQS